MTVAIIVILTLMILGLGYALLNTLRKLETLEDWFSAVSGKLQDGYRQLKSLDYISAYEKDTELGFFFELIREIWSELLSWDLIEEGETLEEVEGS